MVQTDRNQLKQISAPEELLNQRRMTLVTSSEENLFDDEEIIEGKNIFKLLGISEIVSKGLKNHLISDQRLRIL